METLRLNDGTRLNIVTMGLNITPDTLELEVVTDLDMESLENKLTSKNLSVIIHLGEGGDILHTFTKCTSVASITKKYDGDIVTHFIVLNIDNVTTEMQKLQEKITQLTKIVESFLASFNTPEVEEPIEEPETEVEEPIEEPETEVENNL